MHLAKSGKLYLLGDPLPVWGGCALSSHGQEKELQSPLCSRDTGTMTYNSPAPRGTDAELTQND